MGARHAALAVRRVQQRLAPPALAPAGTAAEGGGGARGAITTPPPPPPSRVLVTGAGGQVGQELVAFLRARYGEGAVVASDVREAGGLVRCDVTDAESVERAVLDNGVDCVVHLASLLSAVGERNPQLALRVNTAGIQNVLELARAHGLRVFAPSTIAVFGDSTPKHRTPDDTVTAPTTMYGLTKVHLELLGTYYNRTFGVDFRSLRYPGVVSAKAPPGGGTTDYAVEVFHEALASGRYRCFLARDASLPMMYMPDCLRATVELMEAPRARLSRCVYNVTAVSFTPEELASSVRRHVPELEVEYAPDFRQQIAATWPSSIDDSLARHDWGWRPEYGLDAMTDDMVAYLRDVASHAGEAEAEAEAVPA